MSRRAIARGLTPSANSLKIRRDDLGLGLVDPPPAGLALDRSVAVGPAARRPALQHPPELAAPRLVLEVRQVELGHRAEQADMHGADGTHVHGMQCDAAELEPVVQGGDVGQPATDPVQRLDHHDVEQAALGIGQQRLIARPGSTGTRERPILVDPGQLPALPLGVAAADLHLVLDRGRTLAFRAVAGIDDRAHRSLPAQLVQDIVPRLGGAGHAGPIVVALGGGDRAMAEQRGDDADPSRAGAPRSWWPWRRGTDAG